MTKLSQNMLRTASLTGLLLGGFVISALAADWTAPKHAPPSCPNGEAGCDTPINVSSSAQTKAGRMTFSRDVYINGSNYSGTGLTVFGKSLLDNNFGARGCATGNVSACPIQIKSSDKDASKGRFLMAVDSEGNATWAPAPGGIKSLTSPKQTLLIQLPDPNGNVEIEVNDTKPTSGSVGGGCYPGTGQGQSDGSYVACWGNTNLYGQSSGYPGSGLNTGTTVYYGDSSLIYRYPAMFRCASGYTARVGGAIPSATRNSADMITSMLCIKN